MEQVQDRTRKIILGSWNIRTLMGKSIELVNVMFRRKINIACLQEKKWKGNKAKVLGEMFKLIYSRMNGTRSGVGIVVDNVFLRMW